MTALDHLPLFQSYDCIVDEPKVGTLDERFDTYCANNPAVYRALCILARRMKSRGLRRIGMKSLLEVLRWEWTLATADPDGFRVNNSYGSRYSRLIMAQEPDLAGIFETRSLRSRCAA